MSAETWNPLEARMARLEGAYEQLDKRLAGVETGLSEVRTELRTLRSESHQQFLWVIGVVILGALLPIVVQLVTN